jgi:hypothetical protein
MDRKQIPYQAFCRTVRTAYRILDTWEEMLLKLNRTNPFMSSFKFPVSSTKPEAYETVGTVLSNSIS